MASLYIFGATEVDVDYSLVDGHVRRLEVNGLLLFDEDTKVEVNGWRSTLLDIVWANGLDIDRDGLGVPAFINPLLSKTAPPLP